MKKSYLVMASIIGIFTIGILGMIYAQHQPIQTAETIQNPSNFTVIPKHSIEITGLEPVINWQKPIKFSILAHKFSGCIGINILIFHEFKVQPPIFEKQFVTECNDDSKTNLREYEFPIVINSTSISKPGKYVVTASFYQDRATSGNIEQSFEIAKQYTIKPIANETVSPDSYIDSDCESISEQMKKLDASINKQKATSLAESSFDMKLKILQEGYQNNGVSAGYVWEDRCNIKINAISVNYISERHNTELIVTEDPTMTKITDVQILPITAHY